MSRRFKNILGLGFLASCGISSNVTQVTPTITSQESSHTPHLCALKTETLRLANGTRNLPDTGTFVSESHLAVIEDHFDHAQRFPRDSFERINTHVNRACTLLTTKYFPTLHASDCKKIYKNRWDVQWTPPESGQAGQGSVREKPTAIQEMWSGNMYWTSRSKPHPGEKFLVEYKGRSVVIAMGFETGPFSNRYLGGLQPEVLWALGAKDSSQVKLGRLVDQTLNYGPIICKSAN